jgi:chromosome segregation ATPase
MTCRAAAIGASPFIFNLFHSKSLELRSRRQDARTSKRIKTMAESKLQDAPHTANDAGNAARETMQRTTDTAREGFQRAGAEVHRIANRGLEMGSQTVDAYVEAGKRASAAISDVNKAVTETYNRNLADFDELSKQAVTCKTLQDYLDLQGNMLQKAQDNFSNMTRLYSLYFNAITKSMEPIAARIGYNAEQPMAAE